MTTTIRRRQMLTTKYELLELAGNGGMATVWRARRRGEGGFSRTVAIKRLRESLTENSDFLLMFVEEARVVADLCHPNVVQTHDFDIDDSGAFFLVMDWVEGLDLARWCFGHEKFRMRTPWPLVAAIGIEILKGLGAAHERRSENGRPSPVVHRDVTPHNVLLGVDGIVKLSDFGVARAMDRARVTRPDVVKGKLSYLAPELTLAKDPTPQSDLWAVGVVLFEALTARKLFDATSPVELLGQVREAQVPDVQKLRCDVPRGIADAIGRALKREPAERFETARAMAQALAAVLRRIPKPTGSLELGRSVVEARERLGTLRCDGESTVELAASDLVEVPGKDVG